MSETPKLGKQNFLLRQAREEQNLSQFQIAEKIGVDERTYRRWENEGSLPQPYAQQRLLRFFGKNIPEELGFGERTRRTSSSSQPSQQAGKREDGQEITSLSEYSSDSDKLSVQTSLAPLPILTPRQRLQLLRGFQQEYSSRLFTSLQEQMMLALRLQERNDAIASSISLVFHHLETGKVSPLPPETTIIEVYDRTERGLLILGAPGSGKTTLLLSLVQQLLQRAENDSDQPLAIILNLSSWSRDRRPLACWISEQCSLIYGISEHLCAALIAQEQVQFLLDGLDEVAEPARAACIEAINLYRQEHLTPVVICSRSQEYLSLSARLILPLAVEILPISSVQVWQVLNQTDPSLAAIREALHSNVRFSDLLSTPLMLSIVILTYRDTTMNDLPQRGTAQELQREILARYVERMLQRHQRERRFSSEQMISSLSWLAQQMQHHQVTEFYLEALQEDWLSTKWTRIIFRLIFRPSGGLVGGLAFGLLFGQFGEPIYGLAGGLVYGVIFGLIGALVGALFFGLAGGLIFGLVGGLSSGLAFALFGELTGGLASALVFGLLGRLTDIKPIERLAWSWKGSGGGLAVGILGGLLLGLIGGVLIHSFFGLENGLLFGLGIELGSGMGGVLLGGLSGAPLTEHVRLEPNQGIRTSGRNALRVVLIYSLLAGLISGIVLGRLFGLSAGLVSGPIFGLTAGLGGGLAFGGKAYLQHYVLRWFLVLSRALPWRIIDFLEEAKRCILLQRVGGGYRFVHPLLQEYFASLPPLFKDK